MDRVDREVEEETRPPPRYAFIAGVEGGAFHQRQQGDLVPLFTQLPRNFIGHIAAEAIPAQIIGAARLHGADFLDVVRGHVLDAVEFLQASHTARLQSVHRLLGAQILGEVRVGPEVAAARSVHEENGLLVSVGLNRHQRRTGC